MIKQILVTVLLSLNLVSLAFAETYWLNMYGSFSQKHEEFTPSISLPLISNEECQRALEQFKTDNEMVDKISCDLKPLAGAINMAEQWAGN